ncbi:hypothetical protein HYFRA_00008984 [Hymenoscyphus fraxineus]|uniref:Rhodopsin domain-containing protein n=1 Tax=Hymenoscyphus fraxineus TaxID=746836 RepID=A0A9N9KV83_9HELO|nr:hypothetical protein HYFRA_00008984 [Hymenoscyphus fraxineus]
MASAGIDLSAFTNIPALPPPKGVTSNFVNPESRATEARAAIYLCLSLMVISVLLRVYARLRVSRSFGADDFVGDPLGPHEWNVPVSKITVRFLRTVLITLCLYAVAAIFVKTTILILYFRIFHPSKIAVLMIWAGIVLILGFYISSVVAFAVMCAPHEGDGGWISLRSHIRCGQPSLKLSAAQGIFSTASDLYVLCIPIKLVWGLQLPFRRKLGVSAIFLTGLLACVCSTIGAVYRIQELDNPDFMWSTVPVYVLAAAELNSGIICSCMPVFFVLFKGLSTKFRIPSLKYFRTKRRRSDNKEAPSAQHSDEILFENEMPQVPRAVITGLRSFIQKVDGEPSKGMSTERPTQLESSRG